MRKTKAKSKKSKSSEKLTEKPTLSRKEELAQKRQKAKERQEFINFTTVYFFIGAFIGLLLFPIGGIKAAGGAFGAILAIALSYKYPRQAIWFFLMYLPFGGTVVYGLAGGNSLFQLAKDAFFIPALIALVQQLQKQKLPILLPKGLKPSLNIMLTVALLTLIFVNGAQQFSPKYKGEQSIMVGILGLKALLGYLPLITCAYYQVRNKRDLLFLTRLHLVLVIICGVLGLIQYQFLSSGKCIGTRGKSGDDLFKASLDARCLVGGALLYSPDQGVIRLPGTFVSPWHWAWFLISNAFLTYATAFSDPSPLWRIAGLGGMAIVFVNAVISGQRIALALVPVVTIILLILTGQVANLKRFIPIGIGLGVILGGAMLAFPELVQERVDSFVGRWNASPPTDFIAEQAQFTSEGQKGIFGQGLGRATLAARTFGSISLIETYYPKLLYEIGPLGVLAFLILVTSLTVITFKTYRSVREPNLRSFAASFWVFVLLLSYNTYWYPLDTDPVGVYYWFFAGVILKLPEIERQEQSQNPEPEIKKDKFNKKRKLK